MALDLETVVRQLTDSGIIAAETLKDFIPPKADPKTSEALVQALVKSEKLTNFQGQQVKGGKSKALKLGAYTILDKIGAGGMGQVFKAEHRKMHRLVAIKMLPHSMMKDAAAIARFEREVMAAAKLRHPNIVAADDAAEANGAHFLVMEYVEGKDLSALVKKHGPFPLDKAVNYVQQAAKGLEFAHKKGVVHRDIKPANLLLDNEGTVKILDMGLARLDSSVGSDAGPQAELTGTGTIMGTVDYMSPEQALNTKHADHRADIYSLGCSLYYLIAGKAAYDGETVMEKLMAHQNQPIPSLRGVQAEAPEQVQAVFKKMVAKKLEDRYQSMTEVVAELEKCQAALTASASSSTGVWQAPATNKESDISIAFAPQRLRSLDLDSRMTVEEPQHKPGSKGPPRKNTRLLIAAGAAGFLFVLLGVIVIVRNKDGKEVTRLEVPDGNSVEVQPMTLNVTPVTSDAGQPIQPWNTPAFQQWIKAVAAMPAEKQVEAVSKKLVELNRGFDGKVTGTDRKGTPKIVGGVVTELGIVTDNVTDISPLRALAGLRLLTCSGSTSTSKSSLSDLSPLQGLNLTVLRIGNSLVSDLSPLRGMPLTLLHCDNTRVSDLLPLQGMPLTYLNCGSTQVSDLSPLKGMKLYELACYGTEVSDLSPLRGMPLTALGYNGCGQVSNLSPLETCKSLETLAVHHTGVTPAAVAALQKALPNCKIEWDGAARKPITNINDTAFQQWMKSVAALPAEKQVEAVSKKLMELNPGFDGKVTGSNGTGTPKIENGIVTAFEFVSDNVVDISPVRVLVGLNVLNCVGTGPGKGKVSDLSPLQGIPLKYLSCSGTQVSDLAPLQGMPLIALRCTNTKVIDLSPLQGMRLTSLHCYSTEVSDLSPLEACKSLSSLVVTDTNVTPAQVAALQKALPNCKIEWDDPAKTATTQPNQPWNTSAFQQWVKATQALPAEQQIEAVSKKLMELNPGFDGKVMGADGTSNPKIEKGVVTGFGFVTDYVTDISPVRVLAGLRMLVCKGSSTGKGSLFDLSPLEGIKLLQLSCASTQVTDLSLSLLEGLKHLGRLALNDTKVTPAAIAALQKALPACKIEWDDPAKPKSPEPAASGTK